MLSVIMRLIQYFDSWLIAITFAAHY